MSDEFPSGATLAGGSFRLGERLRGSRDRGMFRARSAIDLAHGAYLVTVGSRQSQPHARARAELAMATPGIAALRYVGTVEGEHEGHYDAMVEDEPAGAPLAARALPLAEPVVVMLLFELLAVLDQAHSAGVVVAGLRPELIYVRDASGLPTLSGIAPRAERFLATALAPSHGVPPMFDDVFLAPEALAMAPLDGASDVFSLCAVAAQLLTGQHPVAGDTVASQAVAISSGRRRGPAGSPGLAALLDAGMSPARRDRPDLAALKSGLAELLG
jgi:hypothetical protein